MSLSYSIYQTNDTINNNPTNVKKRIPTLGKPKLDTNANTNVNELNATAAALEHEPTIMINDAEDKEKRLNRVNQLILHNTMSSDERMGNFTPLAPPLLTKSPDDYIDDVDSDNIQQRNIQEQNHQLFLQQQQQQPSFQNQKQIDTFSNPYPVDNNESSNINYGSYHDIYTTPSFAAKSAPSKTTLAVTSDRREMDKIWEKLNYMTLLLEEQRVEQTNFITEEFILYTFLGIFMIYIVDGFSRSSNKYIR